MSTATRTLLELLMALSKRERAALARELLLSLEGEDFDADCETAWAAEIERRMEAVDQGQFSAQPWREAIQAIRQSLSQRPES
jgi:putative addiction module component (TIGR02574 family)